jgi:protocatechuate 3,4-dioxygenase, alpha subunit
MGQPANNTAFTGFGRAACDGEGVARFRTVKPGPVPGPGRSMQAPHVSLGLFARGLLKRLHTRLYFPDEAANGADPVLAAVPERRRATLIARYEAGPEPLYRLDIRLRGEGETVFFAVAPGSGA